MCFFAFSKLQLHAHIFSLKKMKHDVRFQHMTSIQSLSMRNHPKFPSYFQDGWRVQNGWILEKFRKGGGGHFSIHPKIYFADFGPLNRAFWAWNLRLKRVQHDFQKMRGGDAVWNFSEMSFVLDTPPVPYGKNNVTSEFPSFHSCVKWRLFAKHLPLLANEDQKWIKLAHWELRQIKMVSILASICFHTCFLKAVSCLDVEPTRVCSCLLYFCCL